jgi:hypothetical protein
MQTVSHGDTVINKIWWKLMIICFQRNQSEHDTYTRTSKLLIF